ncbi:MAG: hypothetical protein RR090_12165 [Niameybacter sp.]
MRRLQFQDAFKVARIIKKGSIKEALVSKVQEINAKGVKDQEKVGIDIIFTLLECAGDEAVEQELYSFLASVFELEAEEVKTMELDPLMHYFKQLSQENNLADFFKKATNLM